MALPGVSKHWKEGAIPQPCPQLHLLGFPFAEFRMPLSFRFLAPLCCSILLVGAEATPTLALQDVRPGMKGEGRTVFTGGKIDTFHFEVLGVQRNYAPGRNLILVRASGGPLAETSILAGMSGSPCYVDGKLMGALSRGFSFAKDPIGAVTPIGEMLDDLRNLPEMPSSRTPLILPKLDPPKVLKAAMLGQMIPLSQIMGSGLPGSGLPGSGLPGSGLPGAGEIQPMTLFGSELTPEAKALWDGVPVRFLSGPMVSGNGEGVPSPLEPGGMVAINLCQGDLQFSAAGTITYVSGKKIMLFGHPLFNLGVVDLPMWSATVAASLGSYQESMKLAQAVAPIGALRLDRSSGVAGVLGAEPHMVPMRLGLDLAGKKNLNFRFELMDHPFITPNLAAMILVQAISSNIRGTGLQSLSLQGNIKIANHPALQIECMVADLNANRLGQYLGSMIQAISMNPFERPVIEGISVTVKAEERLDLTLLAGVRTLKARVKRGEVLPVLVTLQNVQGVRETTTFNLNVPLAARAGRATLRVGDGFSLIQAESDERSIEMNGLGDLVRILNNAMRNNHLYGLLIQDAPGAGLRGSRIEAVPPTITSLLGSDGDAVGNRLKHQIISRGVLPLDSEVHGFISLELDIE